MAFHLQAGDLVLAALDLVAVLLLGGCTRILLSTLDAADFVDFVELGPGLPHSLDAELFLLGEGEVLPRRGCDLKAGRRVDNNKLRNAEHVVTSSPFFNARVAPRQRSPWHSTKMFHVPFFVVVV